MAAPSKGSIISLYRAYARQIRRLPSPYLRFDAPSAPRLVAYSKIRQFFRIKASDDIHAILRSTSEGLHGSKMRRVCKDLRKVEAANNGSTKAFTHVLDLAYGRKGKLKWEIMKPILSDPNAPVPPRIIPSVEKSRPPVYSPEMKALLISAHSRKTKPLLLKSLVSPPILPPRADPTSDDARLLGPFSKRREVNIRWKYFSTEWKKVRPPLQIVVDDTSSDVKHQGSSHNHLLRAGIRGVGMQGHGVFDDVEAMVGPITMPKPPTRKERLQLTTNVDVDVPAHEKPRHPSRWLRRRFQELLGRMPILTYSRYTNKNGQTLGKYSVSLSSKALAPSLRFDPSRIPEVMTVSDQEWLKLANKKDDEKEPKGKA